MTASRGVGVGLLATCLAAAGLAGCGGASGTGEGDRPASDTPAVGIAYDGGGGGSEGRWRVHADVIVQGPDHIRVTERSTGMSPMLFVFDGQRLLEHSSEDGPPWTLYEEPTEHPGVLAWVLSWRPDPTAAGFDRFCLSATPIGTDTILGRPAHGYRCAGKHSANLSFSPSKIWIDDRTGVLLKGPFVSASEVTEGVSVDSATFTTDPPANADVRVVGGHGTSDGSLRQAPDFQLPLVGGGTATLAGYLGRPLVLVFWSSDLYFDGGEECARCRTMFRTLAQVTAGGRSPALLVIVNGDQGKPGHPLVPHGPPLPTANDTSGEVQSSYGLTDLAGLALVDSRGRLVQAFNRPPSDRDLRLAVANLR